MEPQIENKRRVGRIPWNKGKKGLYHCSEETKKKMSEIMLGKELWNRGKTGLQSHSEETREKIRLSMKGEKHYLWKGEKVGYLGLHLWVQRELGKATKCADCGKEGTGKQIHWSNVDHKYRRNVEDFTQRCAKCHRDYDKKNNLTTRY